MLAPCSTNVLDAAFELSTAGELRLDPSCGSCPELVRVRVRFDGRRYRSLPQLAQSDDEMGIGDGEARAAIELSDCVSFDA